MQFNQLSGEWQTQTGPLSNPGIGSINAEKTFKYFFHIFTCDTDSRIPYHNLYLGIGFTRRGPYAKFTTLGGEFDCIGKQVINYFFYLEFIRLDIRQIISYLQ